MNRLTSNFRLYWLLQALGWGLWGLVGLVLSMGFGRSSWVLIPVELVVAGTMLAASHALRTFVRHHGWARLPPGRLLPRLLAINVVIALAATVIMSVFIAGMLWLWLPQQLVKGFPWLQYVGYFITNSMALWLWSAVYFGLHYFDNFRAAEIDTWKLAAIAREAELRTLQAQLNPHFLFNGLNNIRALVMEDPARARAMMTHLAELLRYSMQRNTLAQVPLATELEIVENYLQLEAMQLEERLRYTLDVAPEALPVLLPPMTVQLLVENAIKHGLAPRPAGGCLSLSAQLDGAGTGLLVAVRNTGTYQPTPGHPGVGVRNVGERLRLLFGPAASFRIGPDPLRPDTVLAELRLPVGKEVMRAKRTSSPPYQK
ncbi:sensor histidine kinase [Hymenobacter psoromatis]|uniref:sensor histidine kinase n=1 Tax=Hymenobacter psoromatis TaxID=1484116 RepID=UPI001CBEC605|nr:histidine kinase [Hymenobacter psoromatis]